MTRCLQILTLFLSAVALCCGQQAPLVINKSRNISYIPMPLPSISGGPSMVTLAYNAEPLSIAKISPKKVAGSQLHFNFVVIGYGKNSPLSNVQTIRIRVYTESSVNQQQFGIPVARELMRIWELNKTWLGIDHNSQINGGDVDVYLCNEGKPGGEQLFGTDDEGGTVHKVNTIYIYNLQTFTDPLEEAREVAHEYGHAVLPAIGGYKSPEYWANGYMGEELFLRWLDEEIRNGSLKPKDAMNASLKSLDQWVKIHTEHIEIRASERGPLNPMLRSMTAQGMNAYHGLMLYCDTIFPAKIFARSIAITPGTHAVDYLLGAKLAAEETTYSPKFINYLLGRPVWIPVGNGKVLHAKILAHYKGWDKIIASQGVIVQSGQLEN